MNPAEDVPSLVTDASGNVILDPSPQLDQNAISIATLSADLDSARAEAKAAIAALAALTTTPVIDSKTPITADPSLIKPIMGGIKDFYGYSEPWTGGKPMADWSGLDGESGYNPNFIRGSGPKAAVAYNQRLEGLSKKFVAGHNLDNFCKNLMTTLSKYGMDTICHRTDPDGGHPAKMINVLKFYSRLNKAYILEDSKILKKKFDLYDRQNDASAREFLLNSLGDALQIRIEAKIKDKHTFADVLFVFLEVIRPLSADLYLSIEKRIDAIVPQNYPGENIVDMCTDLRLLIIQLIKARAWDSKKNIDLCRTLASAGGINNYEYQFPMTTLLTKVKKECSVITHLANEDKAIHMASSDLSWEDIIEVAEELYNEQSTPGFVRWGPACNPKDSKAPPSQFGAHLTQVTPHSNNYQYGNRGSNSQHGARGNSINPKKIPPSANAVPKEHVNGEPLHEKQISGVTFQWCNKCTRWSTTHNTGTHTGKIKSATPSGGHEANLGLVPDPSLFQDPSSFLAEITLEPEPLVSIELHHVLTKVASVQSKPKPTQWVNAVACKLNDIGITETSTLLDCFDRLNPMLSQAGHSTFHHTTLLGLVDELRSTVSAPSVEIIFHR